MEDMLSATEQTRNFTLFNYIQMDACCNWDQKRESLIGNSS